MLSIQETAKELGQLERYLYSVKRYLAGLQRLTVVVTPMQKPRDARKFITFETVKYMQMLTHWREAPFILGTPDECRDLLERVGIPTLDDIPWLFYAQLPKSHIQIVCCNAYISDEMPTC
ncbi:MAG: hypothetical protein GY832_25860 [Chloroflexi bacterium]|nr:hypothetical protein [Chloroflexota bacterium]